MNQQDHIVEALYTVSAWNIPDEELTKVVKDWANLLTAPIFSARKYYDVAICFARRSGGFHDRSDRFRPEA